MGICQWMFCRVVKNMIIRLTNKEIYQEYGDEIIGSLIPICSNGLKIVRYPSSEEIMEEIYKVKRWDLGC